MIRNCNASFGDPVYFHDVAEMAAALDGCGLHRPDGAKFTPEDLKEGRDFERVQVKLRNLLTGKTVAVRPSTDSPDSSYGLECWVDGEGNSYGQCQFGAPFGFDLIVEEIPVGKEAEEQEEEVRP